MKKYYEDAKYNAAFVRCVDVMSRMLQKYGHQVLDKLEQDAWSLAADMAAEAAILELKLPGTALKRDEEAQKKLAYIKEENT